MSKRGQNASGAAILLVVITAILVLYILFLPPEDRAVLLGEQNYTDGDDGETISGYNKTLLRERVGRLDYLKFDAREHELPSFRIYSDTEGTVIKTANSITAYRSLGSNDEFNMSFKINSRLTDNAVLSFNVREAKGDLIILLNGEQIYSGSLSIGTPNPFTLSSDLLENDNILTFRVSSPGVAFWRTNSYRLDNVQVTADVLDLSQSTSRQYFFVTEEEKLNLESVRLRFRPECKVREVGPLEIYLNGQEVYTGIADCGIFNTIYMDRNMILQDRNELEFVATEGSYLIDLLTVKTDLEEQIFPVYYFDLDEDLFIDEDLDKDFNVTIRIRFVNDEDKRMEYLINGRKRHVNLDEELIFEEEISEYVLPQSNSLELIPNSVIDIAELKVILDEKD